MIINRFVIEFDDFQTEAMKKNRNFTVFEILQGICNRIKENGIVNACDGLTLRDENGNDVGQCQVDWEND